MTNSTYDMENLAVPLPITEEMREVAQGLADKQLTSEKAEQIRLNTLAVLVVKSYLKLLGFETSLRTSDLWNPLMRMCADVADVAVASLGRLECRPVRPQAQVCAIPPEVWEDRIGYVVVQIDESLSEALLLGFTQTAAVETLPLNRLRSPEALIDHLHYLMQLAAVGQQMVNLRQWLQGVFEEGWQTLESLFGPSEPNLAFSFRGQASAEIGEALSPDGDTIRRAKLINLGIQLRDRPKSSSAT